MKRMFVTLLIITVIAANEIEDLLPYILLPPKITACGPNGILSDCTSKCPAKCSNFRQTEPLVCTDECVKGCLCNRGYIIDDESGLCISPEYCNKIVVSNSKTNYNH